MRALNCILSGLVGLFIWSGLAAAQCPIPDQLDGGLCCTTAGLKLPGFPNFNQPALEICWRDCSVNAVLAYTATWKNFNLQIGQPGTVSPCGERMVTLELRAPGGVLHWAGTLRFQYSRTWMETNTAGTALQVWRFLINGDLRSVVGLPIPCPVPACAPAFGNSARFTGYMDIARNCAIAAGPFQRAWMLSHVCDFVDHAPGFPRAGVFHPDRSYSFVGPAAGFVPGPLQPIEGTPGSFFEAMRRRTMTTAGGVTCDFEERLNHSLLPNTQFCLCGTPTPQFLLGSLSILGGCGSSVTTPGLPFLPGYLSMGIGSWTLPGVFPGVEVVRWNAGGYDYFEPCTGALTQEVFFGATTIGGYPATQLLSGLPGLPLPLTFIDQSNSLVPPIGAGGTTMNVPYVSDHILNLNH